MRVKNISIIIALIALALSNVSCSSPQTNKTAEQEIWEHEEIYSANHMDANHAGILSMYHKDFIGWPDEEPKPARKSDMPDYLRRVVSEPSNGEFEIERNGIQVIDDVAIDHCTVHLSYANEVGEKVKRSIRVTHTWLREDGQWKILGGMSNNQ